MKVEDLAEIIEPQLPDNPIVLTIGGGLDYTLLGLGDHCIFTTLPERFVALGYDVYLDKDIEASNDEILDVLWKRNPYIKGFSDKKPNAGTIIRQGMFYEIANRLRGHRSIESMERAHGLPPPYGMAPKIYYDPKPHKLELRDTVLLDFSAVSSGIARDRVAEIIGKMASAYRNPTFLQVMHPKHIVVNQQQYISSCYMETSMLEYLDMMASCRAWIGSEAGGQSLASAVRGEHDVYDDYARPEVVVLSTRKTFNSRGYTYRTNDYRVTANDGDDDAWKPGENEVLKYRNQVKVRHLEMHQRAERG